MNKTCARCAKVVYPIEELKCLDKTWHKTCFRCHECGMTLNMKTYKGYSKLPYCEAHIPKAKATAIADTPELKRIAENTKIQSNVKYHADFEKQKGKFTQVADDPETLRIKQNTKIISNVAYHGDLEKKAAMEKQREAAEVAESRDNESEYFSETLAAEQFSQYQKQPSPPQYSPPPPAQQTPPSATSPTNKQLPQPIQQQQYQQPIHNVQAQNNSKTAQIQQQYAQSHSQNNSHHTTYPANVSSLHPQQQQHHNNVQPQHHNQQQQQAAYQQQQQQQLLQQQQQQAAYHQQQQQLAAANRNAVANHHHHASQQQSNFNQQHQHQQPQPQNIRSAAVQSSHHPAGSLGIISRNNSDVAAKYYDQYENYARPATTPHSAQHSSNFNNNHNTVYNSNPNQQQQLSYPGYNNSHVAQQQLLQQQQQQQTNNYVQNTALYTQMTYGRGDGHNHAGTTILGNGGSNGSANVINSVGGGIGIVGNGGSGGGIGKIADYDPLTDGPRNVPNTHRQSATLIYSSDRGAVNNSVHPRRVGSIADIDPANGIYGSMSEQQNGQNQYYHQQQQNQLRQQQKQQQQQHQHHQQQQQISNNQTATKANLRVFRALYDYEAQDTDEVGFSEGDIIFEVESIDSGWMTGKVERTGKTGMLPANYVEPAMI